MSTLSVHSMHDRKTHAEGSRPRIRQQVLTGIYVHILHPRWETTGSLDGYASNSALGIDSLLVEGLAS